MPVLVQNISTKFQFKSSEFCPLWPVHNTFHCESRTRWLAKNKSTLLRSESNSIDEICCHSETRGKESNKKVPKINIFKSSNCKTMTSCSCNLVKH